MRIARPRSTRSLAVAVAAAGLLAGGGTTAATGVFTTDQAAQKATTDTVAVAAAGHSQKQSKIIGRYEKRDVCAYLVTAGGKRYYLPGYTIGGNGGLYKKGGGFIAYPGWKIQANGTKYYKPMGRTTTLCTTWGIEHGIKTKSIYALEH